MAAREVVLPVGARAKVRDEGLVVLWTVQDARIADSETQGAT